MPTPHRPTIAVQRALRKLGADIRDARLRRGLPADVVASRALTSRATIARIEKGDAGVGMGIYAATLLALGLLDRLAEVADPRMDEVGMALSLQSLPKRARLPKKAAP